MRRASAVGTLGIAVLLAAPAPAGEIHHYASTGKVAQVEALLRGGVSPDKAYEEGRTPLYFAAVNKHPEVVRVLLDKGADPNIPTPRAPPCTARRRRGTRRSRRCSSTRGSIPTALTTAARVGQVATVKVLLELGADPRLKMKSGATALTNAVESGNEEVVALIKAALAKGKPPAPKP